MDEKVNYRMEGDVSIQRWNRRKGRNYRERGRGGQEKVRKRKSME